MISLFPGDAQPSVDPWTAVPADERTPPDGRPWVYTNMIASPDGGTAVAGLSGGLGGPGDKTMFAALRSVADVILVGASTVREEQYRPSNPRETTVAARVARGQEAKPIIAVVTRSLDLEPDLPLFADPDYRPIIFTAASSPADRRERIGSRADVITAGETGVDLTVALAELADRGHRTVLSEGGPSLNGQLIAADLVDEWNLSISPTLLGADSKRAAVGPLADGPPPKMTLSRVWTDESFLFCRWVRRTDS
ncbi:MAG: dihydrofolate reductase family protein [Actinomycetota bacterium]